MIRLEMADCCLVCGKSTSSTHLGMNVCRACSVFYRRNREIRDKLVCINVNPFRVRPNQNKYLHCANRKIASCRKCRLMKFEAVVRAGIGKPQIRLHPLTAANSLIEWMREEDRTLSRFRQINELKIRGISIDPSEETSEINLLFPCTYTSMDDGKKIQIAGLFKFIESIFPEFRILNANEQWLLIRNYYRTFHCLDSAFRVLRTFGKDSTVLFFGSYTNYLSWDCLDQFFSDCPDKSHIETAVKILPELFKKSLDMTSNVLNRSNISEEEFIALMGLAFWSLENIEASDEVQQLASCNRTDIIAELVDRYRCTIGEENGASRIGTLMCMLHEVKTLAESLTTTYELFLGVFSDETVTYKLRL